jgi:hypothetical protein
MTTEPLEEQSLLSETGRPTACDAPEPSGGSSSRLGRARQFLGATVLRVCREGRRECTKPNCWLQPVCACARADLAAARRMEARVWILIAICGGVVIIMAAIWSVW